MTLEVPLLMDKGERIFNGTKDESGFNGAKDEPPGPKKYLGVLIILFEHSRQPRRGWIL
jgi:hypothetical protein